MRPGRPLLVALALCPLVAPASAAAAPTPAGSLQAQATASSDQVQLSGQVTTTGNRSGIGVQVAFDGRTIGTVTTDPQGNWHDSIRLGPGQPAGSHQVVVTATVQGQQLRRELTVATLAPNASRITALRVQPAAVRAGQRLVFTGKLVDATSHPLAGRQVQVQAFGAAGYLEAGLTGSDGSFDIDTQVPLGYRPGTLRPWVTFPGDEGYRASRLSVPFTVQAGGPAAWTPPPTSSATHDASGPDDPAPAATLVAPASPRPRASNAPAPSSNKDALPSGLRIGLTALAGLGLLVGLAVASRRVRPPDDEWDRLIG